MIITKIIIKMKNTPGPSSPFSPSSYSIVYFLQIDAGGELNDAQNSLKISSPF